MAGKEYKFCKDCNDYQPVEAFSKNARSRDGLAFCCREHLSARGARSREARRTKPRVNRRPPEGLAVPPGRKWCADCGEVMPLDDFVRSVAAPSGYSSYCKPCHNVRSRKSRDKVGGSRTYHLTRRYGITAAEADHMLTRQGGVCAICRRAPAGHVDHDHTTGAVRALLCFNCNGGLGQFKDDPDVLRAAADYVEEHRRRQARPRPMRVHRSEVTVRPPLRRDSVPPWMRRHRHLLCDRGRARLAASLGEA